MNLAQERWLAIAARNPAGVEAVHRCEQGAEIIRRVRRIAARLYPPRASLSGYYDLPEFIARAPERERERRTIRDVHARLAEKVRARDVSLTIEQKALRIAARERSV